MRRFWRNVWSHLRAAIQFRSPSDVPGLPTSFIAERHRRIHISQKDTYLIRDLRRVVEVLERDVEHLAEILSKVMRSGALDGAT